MATKLSPRDLILLSSYLDDELTPREKAWVETRLNTHPEFREALAGLQRTKEVLRRAPARRVPRNFTLPASMAQSKPNLTLRLVPALRLSSAVAALVSVFLMVGMFVSSGLRMASPVADTAGKEAMTLQSAPAAEAEQPQQPPVVYWGGPPTPQASGMGGAGGAGCPEIGPCGGGAADTVPSAGSNGVGGGDGGFVPPPMVMATQPPAIFKAQPTAQAELPQPTTTPAAEEPVSGSGPILGVAPSEEQGEILPETNRQSLPLVASSEARGADRLRTITTLGWIGVGLFVLAVGMFITALVLRKKAQR